MLMFDLVLVFCFFLLRFLSRNFVKQLEIYKIFIHLKKNQIVSDEFVCGRHFG